MQHKTNEHDIPAPVVFNETEAKALRVYMDFIRPRFTDSTDSNLKVFVKSAVNNKDTQISLSKANHILSNYKTISGKKLSTRISRMSKTTEQRKSDPTINEIEEYSRSLSHTTATSDRYYVATDLEESVINSLERQIRLRKQNTVNFVLVK